MSKPSKIVIDCHSVVDDGAYEIVVSVEPDGGERLYYVDKFVSMPDNEVIATVVQYGLDRIDAHIEGKR